MSTPETKIVSGEEVNKEVTKNKQGVLLQLYCLSMTRPQIHTNPQLQSILESHMDVFEEPTHQVP